MQTEENSRPVRKTKKTNKIIYAVLLLLLALVLLVAVVVPAFVSSQKGKQKILAAINRSVDGKTDFTGLSMSWFKGVEVTDLSYDDVAGRTSVRVEKIAAKPHYISLLTGALSFGRTVVDKPSIKINLAPKQPVKPAVTPPAKPIDKQAPPDRDAGVIMLPVKQINLVVKDGDLKVTGTAARTVNLSQINAEVNLRPPGRKTAFDINTTLNDAARQSAIHASGSLTPKRQTGWSLKGTSGDLAVEVNDLDIASLTPLFSLFGADLQAKGNISADLKSKIKDGLLEDLNGTVKGKNLDISGPALKGDSLKTSLLNLDVQMRTEKDLLQIDKLTLRSDWAAAEAAGTIPKSARSLEAFLEPDAKYDLKASFDCDLAALASQMPRTLNLKEGTKITSGRLKGNVETETADKQRVITAAVNIDNLKGTLAAKTISLSQPVTAQTRITSDKAGVKFESLRASAAFAEIMCTGTKEQLKYDASIDLAKLQSELGQFVDLGPYQMAGNLTGNGQISIDKNKISASGKSTCKNLRLTSKQQVTASEPRADIDFSLDIELDENIVNIVFFNTKTSFGQVSLKDSLIPTDKNVKKPVKFALSADVDLAGLQPFAVLLAGLPKDMQLAGKAKSQLSVTSKNGAYKIFTDSTQIENLQIISPDQQPLSQQLVSVVFDGDYSPAEKNLLVRKIHLISPDIKIRGDFQHDIQVGQTKVQGKADLEYDWSAVSTVASPFLPRGLKLSGKRKDTLNFASSYPTGQTGQLLPNLTTEGKIGFDRAEYMGLTFGSTDVDISVQNGLLNIAPFSTTVNRGSLNFAAAADFKQKPTLLKTPRPMRIISDVQINDVTSQLLLKYLNPVFSNAVNVSGLATLDCQTLEIPLAGATKKDLKIVGTVAIEKLQLQASDLLGQIMTLSGIQPRGQYVRIHPTSFALQNGILAYDDMQMDFGDTPLNFRGTIGLDKTLDMFVTLPLTTRGRIVRIGEPAEGARIALPIGGTADKPELSVGRMLEGQLIQQLEGLFR